MVQGYPPLNSAGTPGRSSALTLRNVVTFSDDGSPVTLGELPAGAIVLDAWVNVTTAFDDSTASNLDIGFDGDVDALAVDEDVSATGVIDVTFDGAGSRYLSAADTLVAQFDGTAGDATAGSCEVILTFVVADA